MALLCLAGPALAERRVALVIGNGAYRNVPVLPNPANDARAIAATLTRLGFDAELVIDADRAGMEAAIRRLGDRAAGVDVALFFYAGHAVEVAGRNYLIPVSANIQTARDLPFETLDFEVMLGQVEGRARVALVLLDACRENPFRAILGATSRGITVRAGMAPVQSATGTLIAFSTAPGQVAQDGNGSHSPFTAALLEHLETPGLEVRQVLARVRRAVREATAGQQVPWETSALEGDVFLRPAAPAPAPPPTPATGRAALAPVAGPSARAVAPADPEGPAIGASFDGRITLPDGELPLPPGKWRLVGLDTRPARVTNAFRRSNAFLVQEANGRVTAMLRLVLRVATGPRAERWGRFACTALPSLAQRTITLNGDRMDCIRVTLWSPVALPSGPELRDIDAVFAEARTRTGWLPSALLSVGATIADDQRQANYMYYVDPAALGFPPDAKPAETWSPRHLDTLRRGCVTALSAWADRLRPILRQFVAVTAGPPPAAVPAPVCRAR